MNRIIGAGFLAVATLVPIAASSQVLRDGWSLQVGIAHESFAGGSEDTTIAGTRVEVFPSGRAGYEAAVGWRRRGWDVGLALGYSNGNLTADAKSLAAVDKSGGVKRYRAGLTLARRVAQLGAGSLSLSAGPTLDHWDLTGIGTRTTFGARGGLLLRFPLGRLELENAVIYGLSASPFNQEDVAPSGRLKTLRAFSFGAGLRYPF